MAEQIQTWLPEAEAGERGGYTISAWILALALSTPEDVA
jgi:hypothetical protein